MSGSDGIRTHALWKTGALNQRLGPLGHTTYLYTAYQAFQRNDNR